MKNCDFFIFPSKYEREAFPVVSLEAVACGCLFISSSVNGINEIFDTERTDNNDDKIITYFVDKINTYINEKRNIKKKNETKKNS